MFARRSQLPETAPLMWVDWLALAALTCWGLYWLAPGLGHPSIHNWDESFHQAAVRGTAKAFFAPHILEDPFYPLNLRQWWNAGIWMHKPAGVFWWGALMLKLFGVSTAALRSASLLGELSLGWLTFLLIRPLAGRALAILAPASFFVLPWGWLMTQGHFVADVTDITVAAFVALGFAWLWMSVEKDSARWAFAAGAAIGLGYLCKTFLALAPLGVAGAWWAAGVLRFCRGPKLSQVGLMFLGFAVVAGPWNLYAWHTWPDVYVRAFDHTVGFMSASSGEDVGSGARPPDAIFQEINWTILGPIPYPFTLLCGLWLLISAVKTRDGREVALSLWLWSTWIVHSFANVKGHGHLWNVMPAVFVAYAVTLRDAFKNLALAAAVVASLLVWELRPALEVATRIKAHLPQLMVQARTWSESNLVEQTLIVVPVLVAVALLALLLRRWPRPLRWVTLGTALAACAGVFVFAFPRALTAYHAQWEKMDHDRQWSSTEDLGLALDQVLPEKSVFFMDLPVEYRTNFVHLELMFWSGRMVYRRAPDVATAQAHGYHPYLVSPSAEPFAPVPQVPAFASLRAYDLLVPGPMPPPPPGLLPLAPSRLVNVASVGYAARPLNDRWSRYAFYLRPVGIPSDVRATFLLDDGTTSEQVLPVISTGTTPDRLAPKSWFVLPAVGPPVAKVKAIRLSQ